MVQRRTWPPAAARLTLAIVALGGLLLADGPLPAGAQGSFVEGSADSVATLGQVVMRAAGLPLAVTLGGAVAHYQGVSARAEATTADLGLLGVLLTTPFVCGRPAPLRPDQLPQATVADSAHGRPAASSHLVGNGTLGAGDADVTARNGASSTASYGAADLVLNGVLSAGGARSTSSTELVPGAERRAHAEVVYGDVALAGGAVRLRGLRWTGDQRSGAGGAVLEAGGGFGIAGVEVGGLPLPVATPDQLAAALGTAGRALAPLGLRLSPPQVTRAAGGGGVRVTPLVITLGDGTAAGPVLGPLLTALLPLRQQLVEQSSRGGGGSGCGGGSGAGAVLTAADFLTLALEGRGGLDLRLGGLSVSTDGADYGDPLGLYPPGHLGAGAPVGGTPSQARTVTTAAIPAGPPVTVPRVPPAASSGPPVVTVSRRCESTGAGLATCSAGMPGLGAWLAIAAALLLLGVDLLRSRRRVV